MSITNTADIILQGMKGDFLDHTHKVITLDNGGFVVAWSGDTRESQQTDVFIQRFDSNGLMLGKTTRLKGTNGEYQDLGPSIVALKDGAFAVSWVGETADGQGYDVFVTCFSSDGVQGGRNRIQGMFGPLNDNVTKMAASEGGSFAVTWAGETSDGQGYDVFLQMFDQDGIPKGSASRLYSATGIIQDGGEQIATLNNGSMVVAWQSHDGQTSTIYLQKVEANGNVIHAPVSLQGAGSYQYDFYPQILALDNGGFVVTWHGSLSSGGLPVVGMQRFNSEMIAVGELMYLSGATGGLGNYGPQISKIDDGKYVVVWSGGTSDGQGTDIFVQSFEPDGASIGNAIALRGLPGYLHDNSPKVVVLTNGGFVVAWVGETYDYQPSSIFRTTDIFAQRFSVSGSLEGGLIRLNGMDGNLSNGDCEITALSDGGFIIAWSGGTTDGQGRDIFLQRFDAAGQPISLNYAPVGEVAITGQAEQGNILRADATSIADADGIGTLGFQWFADGVAIVAATSSSFRPGFAQAGKVITVQVTYTDRQGTFEVLFSAATAEVPFGVIHRSAVTVALPDNGYTRDLTLTAGQPIDGTGNSLGNLIVGNWSKNTLSGRLGNDTLEGGGGNDTLNGGRGDDVMFGGLGNDTFIVGSLLDQVIEAAGEGNDRVQASISYSLGDNVEHLTLVTRLEIDGRGNALANSITGNAATNRLRGEGGNDTLLGGGGDDRLIGGVGNDIIRGGAGADEGYGGAGDDQFFGDDGSDLLFGGVGNDTLSGGASADVLRGEGGSDALLGDGGNDTLYGGAGRDTLTGGAGADLFVFEVVKDSPATSYRDTITDFVRGVDRADLSGIDADSALEGDQAFAFLGLVPFSGVAGQLILRTISGTQDSLVLGDVNGDGTADFSIRMLGVQLLSAEDFVL